MSASGSTLGRRLAQVHWPLVAYVALLSGVGLAMLYSAAGGSASPWAVRQLAYAGAGGLVMLGLAVTPPALLMRFAYIFFLLSILMLVVVKVAGFEGKGAQRWVELGGMNLQPSEVTKLALILALARYYHTVNPQHVSRLKFILPPLLLIALPAELVRRQPNLGTATVLTGLGLLMCYMAGIRTKLFVWAGLLAIAAGAAAFPVVWDHLHDYQKRRVLTFLHPEEDPLGAGYNIMQSMIAIGSGGVGGKGYLQGSQGQLDFLPEKHTDFIFTMLAEEFGFIGCALVLGLYMLVMGHGVMVYLRCRHKFGSMLAIGVCAMLLVHIIINVSMVMGLIPVVGVPLPLLSYGGSITLSMMMGIGLLLNAYVYRDAVLPRPGGLV